MGLNIAELMKRTKNETRARILDAAIELLAKKSAQFIQLRDIAERAGVSASLLVQYFGSKEELVFEARLARLTTETETLFAKFHEPGSKAPVAEVLRVCVEHDLSVPAATKDLMSSRWWWTDADEERYREAIKPRAEAMRRALAAYLHPKSESDLGTTHRLADMVYLEALREECQAGASAEQAFPRILALLQPVLTSCGIREAA
jgi:AcrR family transcriptional regulator